MNLISDVKVSINRTNADIFDYVSNMEKFGEWFPGVISITSDDGVAHGEVDKKYLETVKVPLVGLKQISISVVDSQYGHFFVTEGDFSPLLPRMEIDIKKIDHMSSSVSWRMYSRNNKSIVKVLLLPLAKLIMQKRAEVGIKQLKINLEA